MNDAKEMKGKKVNMLTILNYVGSDKKGNALWLCRCECGNHISVRGTRLRNGTAKSCGCKRGRPPKMPS